MSKKTKVLLIILAVLIVVAGVIWFLNGDGGVSADVSGTTGEQASDDEAGAGIVRITDELTTVSAGQNLAFTITVDTKKMFEAASGISNPTAEQFDQWKQSNPYDKFFLLGYLASGRSVASDTMIVPTANFSVQLPELRYPLVEATYAAAATAPNNIDLRGNRLTNIARVVRRPCHRATSSEIADSLLRRPRLTANSIVCPTASKTRIAQHVDTDTITFNNNTTDLAITSLTASDDDAFVGEELQFEAQYRNKSAMIAGGSKLKIKFKEGSFEITDPAFKKAQSETIEGVKYTVYNLSLGDLMPTVNGTNRTDAATIAAIKTALQAALADNTNTRVIDAINAAIRVVNGYAAGTKTLTELTAAVNNVKTVSDQAQILNVDDTSLNTIINWLNMLIPFSRSQGARADTINALTAALDAANQYKAGTKTKTELLNAINAIGSVPGNYMISAYWNSMRSKAYSLPERHATAGFGAGTVAAISQAVSSCRSLSANANTPAESIKVPFAIKALPQNGGIYRFEVTAEITTTSTDSNLTDNKKTIPVAVFVPTS